MEYLNAKTRTVEVYSADNTCILRRACTDADTSLPDISTLHREIQRQRAATIRFEKEVQGINTDHGRISTDRQSQTMIANTLAYTTLSPQSVINWKRTDGTFVTLSTAEFSVLAKAVGDHVETCFRQEAEANEALLSAEDVVKVDVAQFFKQ